MICSKPGCPLHAQEITPTHLAEIKARADGASDGPWEVTLDNHGRDGIEVGIWSPHSVQNGEYIAELITSENAEADAAFIAHARQDVPDLLAEVERLTKELGQLAEVARNALASLDMFIHDHPDPGTQALGDRYLLTQALGKLPATDDGDPEC